MMIQFAGSSTYRVAASSATETVVGPEPERATALAIGIAHPPACAQALTTLANALTVTGAIRRPVQELVSSS